MGVTRGVVSLGIIDILPFWLPRKHAALIHGTLWHDNKGPVPFGVEPFASEARHASTAFSQRFRCAFTVPTASSKASLSFTTPGHRAYQEKPQFVVNLASPSSTAKA